MTIFKQKSIKPGSIYKVVTALTVITLLTACGGKEKQEGDYLGQAETLLKKGDLKKARVAINNVLQINSKNADAFYLSARIEEKEGNWRKVYQRLQEAIHHQPDHLEAQLKLGQIELMAQQLDTAMEKVQLVLNKNPGHPKAHALHGAILSALNKPEDAEKEALKALSLEPGQSEATTLLANLYLQQGKSDEALALLEKGIATSPDSDSLRLIKISALQRLSKIDEAEAAFKDLITLKDNDRSLQTALSRFYVNVGRLDAAEQTLRALVKSDPKDDKAKIALLRFFMDHDKKAIANETLDKFIHDAPQNYSLQMIKAKLVSENGEQSKSIYNNIIEKDGDGPFAIRARLKLATLALDEGQVDTAKQLTNIVLEKESNNPGALLLRAKMSLSDNETDSAVADLRTVLRDQPESVNALKLLAIAHHRKKNIHLAKDALSRIIGLTPRDVKSRRTLARLLVESGETERAIAILKDGVRLAPNDIPTMTLLLDYYVDTRRWEAAENLARDIAAATNGEAIGVYALATVYQGQGLIAKAVTQYERALKLKPDVNAALSGLIGSYLALNDIKSATSYLQNILDKEPQNAFAHQLLAGVYQVKKNFPKAEQSFRKAIRIKPDWAIPYLGLGQLYLQREAIDQAMTVYNEGLERIPGEAALLEQKAQIHRYNDDFEKVIAIYDTLHNTYPENDEFANALAGYIADYDPSDESRRRALKIAQRFRDSENPAYLDTYGWLEYLVNRSNAAVLALETVTRKAPIPIVHYHLGMAYLTSGRTVEAKAALEKALSSEKADFPGVEKARESLKKLLEADKTSLDHISNIRLSETS